MTNLNLLFNKTYYQKLKTDEFAKSLKDNNATIFSTKFDNAKDYRACVFAKQRLYFKTTYPGLLIGTGNPHGAHQDDNDINVGFSFDYVTGQPYIPGSSVKGALRSRFKNSPQVVAELLDVDVSAVKDIEKEIFDGKDVFFDAVLCDGAFDINAENFDKDDCILGEDYITHHLDAVKNPVPVMILKVLPDVRFEFRFDLKDGILSIQQKEALLVQLISLFGVGAKTNVGYGVLEHCEERTAKRVPRQQSSQTRQNITSTPSEYKRCIKCNGKIYKNNIDGTPNPKWRFDTCSKCYFNN